MDTVKKPTKVRSIRGKIAGCLAGLAGLVLGCEPYEPTTYTPPPYTPPPYDDFDDDDDSTYHPPDLNCTLSASDRLWITDQALLQYTQSGAMSVFPLDGSIDDTITSPIHDGILSAIEDFSNLDLNILVLDGGLAEGINARALPANTIILQRDYLEVLYWASAAFVTSGRLEAEGTPTSLWAYYEMIVRQGMGGGWVFTQAPGYNPDPANGLEMAFIDRTFRGALALVIGHEAAHIVNLDYDERICTSFLMGTPYDYVQYYYQQLALAELSREDEFDADNDGMDFVLDSLHHDEFLYDMCMEQCNDGFERVPDGVCDEQDCPYENAFAYEPTGALIAVKILEVMEQYLPADNPFADHPPAIQRYAALKDQMLSHPLYEHMFETSDMTRELFSSMLDEKFR